VGLSWSLKGPLGAPGLVLASTVAVVVQTLVLQRMLARRLPGMEFGELWRTVGKVSLATLAMGVVVAGGWLAARAAMEGSRAADVVAIFGLIPLGAATYAVVLWVLKIEGREEFVAMVEKLRGKWGR
jgi:putative peptidoglycan lipid II flippase